MNILQITNIGNNKSSGIRNIVPENIEKLSFENNIFWLNLYKNCNLKDEYPNVYNTKSDYIISLNKLPAPFNKPDLVVFHGVYFIEYYIISCQLRHKKIPYIIVPHGSLTKSSLEIKKIKKKIAFKLFLNKFIKNALAIQNLTLGEKNSSLELNNKNNIIVPNGVNLLPKEKINKKELDLDKKIKIVFIARKSIFYKGIDLLLEACNNCAIKLREKNVIISLYGPDENESDKVISKMIKEYKLEDIVIIKGAIYGCEKIKILNESDIFILTSRSEGHPVGVLEALSLGKPCILTYGTNMTEQIEKYNAGWIAENNSKSISEALVNAVKDKKKYKTLRKNAYELSKEYSWNKVIELTIKEYKKLINNQYKVGE